MSWIEKNAVKAVAIAVAVLLVIGLLMLHQCSAERTAKVETRLATGQASAAQASGTDAVETVGIVDTNTVVGDTMTKENNDEIRNAQGASAPVAAPVRDAGLASLCRRSSYRGDPKCVQHAPAH